MFSLFAVFAALGVGEAYLAYQDRIAAKAIAAAAPGRERQVVEGEILDEFADELAPEGGDRSAVRDNDSTSNQYFVMDKKKIAEMRMETGVSVPDNFMNYEEEFTNDPILGYRPARHAGSIVSIKMDGDKVVYDVTYTLLPSGWRTTPQHPNATEAVVFFGCSFTFGEGLNDKETFAYKVGEQLGDQYQVFNFGFHGYGPHHMLAMIENGYLDDIAKRYDRTTIFYTTIAGHELRSSGKSSWDQNGPRYELDNNGVTYTGSFQDDPKRKSKLQAPKITRIGEQQRMLELNFAILQQADRILKERYQSSLNVVAWCGTRKYVENYREKGLKVLDITSYWGDDYRIPDDGHPNDFATTVAADKIVEYFKQLMMSKDL